MRSLRIKAMKDLKKLKELVLKEIDLSQVMLDYDVQFIYSPTHATEAQLRCPFHGKDVKPSARYYRETQSMYCWVCKKRWNAITFIKDIEGLNYAQAINLLIKKYKIDVSSIPDDPEFNIPDAIEVKKNDITIVYLKKRIKELKGKIPFEKYRAFCTAFYMITFNSSLGADVSESLSKLETKIG